MLSLSCLSCQKLFDMNQLRLKAVEVPCITAGYIWGKRLFAICTCSFETEVTKEIKGCYHRDQKENRCHICDA